MLNNVLTTGGSTYSYEGKAEKGFAVGGYGKTNHIVSCTDLSERDLLWFTNIVRRIVEEYSHLLCYNYYYLGIWYDSADDSIEIDIVRTYQILDEAIYEAVQNNQGYIYCLEDKKYYNVALMTSEPEDFEEQNTGC